MSFFKSKLYLDTAQDRNRWRTEAKETYHSLLKARKLLLRTRGDLKKATTEIRKLKQQLQEARAEAKKATISQAELDSAHREIAKLQTQIETLRY